MTALEHWLSHVQSRTDNNSSNLLFVTPQHYHGFSNNNDSNINCETRSRKASFVEYCLPHGVAPSVTSSEDEVGDQEEEELEDGDNYGEGISEGIGEENKQEGSSDNDTNNNDKNNYSNQSEEDNRIQNAATANKPMSLELLELLNSSNENKPRKGSDSISKKRMKK